MRGRTPRRWGAGLLTLTVLGTALLAAGPASAVVINDPPPTGHDVISFPQRDFVSSTGYDLAGGPYTYTLIRNGITVGTSTAITPQDDPKTGGFDGIVEVNHPGGGCWVGVTPDIRPGDVVRLTNAAGDVADQTRTANVTDERATSPSSGTIVVHGTADDITVPGLQPLPSDQIEQRLVANRDAFDLNGRRTLRADAVGGADGTLAYDPVGPSNPDGINWTATYTGLTAADVTRALNAESRILWLGRNPAAGVEATIYENGDGIAGGPALPDCTAPAATGPSTPDLVAADDSGASNTDDITKVASPSFTGSVGNPSATSVNLYVDGTLASSGAPTAGGVYTLQATGLTDGRHVITAGEVVGGVETIGSGSLTVSIDTAAPAAPTGLTASAPGNPPSRTPKISGVADAGTTVDLFSDAACTTKAATGTAADFNGAGITVNVAANTTVTFDAEATDVAGNSSTCSVSTASYSTVDTIAPTITFTSKPPATTNQSAASFAFTADEPATFQCSLDSEPFAACTSPVSDPGLADGLHTFDVRASDGTNVGTAHYEWTIDTGAVAVTLDPVPAATKVNTPSFSFTANKAGATFQCSMVPTGSAATFSACTSPKSYTARANGSWTFTVKATDGAGNTDQATAVTVIDTLSPNAPTGVTAAAVAGSTSQLRVSWTAATDNPATGGSGVATYQVFRDGGATAVGSVNAPATTFTDTGLAAGSSHTYTVRAVDAATNLGPASTASAPVSTGNPPPASATLGPAAGLAFGSVTTGTTSASKTATLTNTGSTALAIQSVTIGGTDAAQFSKAAGGTCGTTLNAAASCTILVTFSPTTTGAKSATLTVADDAGNQSIPLTGTGATATTPPTADLAPTTGLAFGTVAPNTSSNPQNATLTNNGGSALSITSIKLTGTNPGQFKLGTNTCGTSLGAGLSCTIPVTFAPTGTGNKSASVTVTDGVGTQSIPVTGTGGTAPPPAGPTLSPTAGLAFGSVTTGTTSASQPATLKNNGTTALAVSGIGIAGLNPAQFAIASNGCPASLAGGASCVIQVAFTPTATGSKSATLTATAGTTALSIPLSGTGVTTPTGTAPTMGAVKAAPGPGTATATSVPVTISWTSTGGTAPITYHVQRSVNGGAFTDVTASTSATSITQTLTLGTSYQYQVQATGGGLTSAFTKGATITPSLAQESSTSIAYGAGWNAAVAIAGASGGSVRSSTTVGSTATFSFNGTGVALVSTLRAAGGKVTISVDGGPATTVDLFAGTGAANVFQQVLGGSGGLAAGPHTVKITVATKNASSTGNRVDLDAFVVL